MHKLFSWMYSHLFMFAFAACAFGAKSKKSAPRPLSRGYLLCFLLVVLWFKVLCYIPQSILNWFLCMVWDRGPISFFCIRLHNFPSTIYWRDFLFLIVYSWHLCYKLIDCICMGLSLGSLFGFIDLCVCFYSNTILIWLL